MSNDIPITHPPRSRLADRNGTVMPGPWSQRPTQRQRPIKKERRVANSWLPTGFHPWLTTFVLATFLFQVLLVPQGLFSIRTPLRVAAFATSLVMLLIVIGRMNWSPITHLGMVITGIFLLQLVNPNNNSFLAACASIGLNFAILSPIFWVSRLKLNAEHLRFLFFTIWAFSAMSSCVGILEVYMPGRFSRESQIAVLMTGEMAEGLKVTLADGTTIYRPMGLTDSPAGAAVSGYSTMLLAVGLLLTGVSSLVRFTLLLSVLAAAFCIYVCQVRSILVISLVCLLSMFAVVAIRGDSKKLGTIIFLVPGFIALATAWAFVVGGEQVSDRFRTLVEGDAATVYFENRGIFLVSTVGDFQQYPLGAGLGRWGMVHQYFGDKSSRAPISIWAEVQPTAWLYDGGVLLIVVYYISILICILNSFRLCVVRRDQIADLATVVFGLNVATLATTFGSLPFIGNAGMIFWLVNTALFTVAAKTPLPSGPRPKNTISRRIQLGSRTF